MNFKNAQKIMLLTFVISIANFQFVGAEPLVSKDESPDQLPFYLKNRDSLKCYEDVFFRLLGEKYLKHDESSSYFKERTPFSLAQTDKNYKMIEIFKRHYTQFLREICTLIKEIKRANKTLSSKDELEAYLCRSSFLSKAVAALGAKEIPAVDCETLEVFLKDYPVEERSKITSDYINHGFIEAVAAFSKDKNAADALVFAMEVLPYVEFVTQAQLASKGFFGDVAKKVAA